MRTARRMHDRHGFTLIELLIVVVIIGVLASIAIPKYTATKEKTYLARMRSDLRNLAVAQEAYAEDNATYYNGPIPNVALTYNPSPSVTVVLSNVSPGGYQATASHPQTTRQCYMYVGTGGPIGTATTDGLISCS